MKMSVRNPNLIINVRMLQFTAIVLILFAVKFLALGAGNRPPIVAFYLEAEQSPSAIEFSLRDETTGVVGKGFRHATPFLTINQIERIELLTQEFNTRPTVGIRIRFKKTTSGLIKAFAGDRRLVIYIDGRHRATFSVKFLRELFEDKLDLFIATPNMPESEQQALRERLGQK